MRYIISGGGTAGHINPAIAIADKLKKEDEDADILFVGSKNGMENKLVTLAGYPISPIDACGLIRGFSLSNFKTLVKTVRAVKDAGKIISDYMPDAVIGTGGYVCFPVLYAAAKRGIFTAVHESNAVPGLAVKLLKNRVDRLFVGFEACKKALKAGEKCIVSGNPLRADFTDVSREDARIKLGIDGRYKYLIVSFGGSLGAKTVNDAALAVMKELSSKRGDILHVHGYGRNGTEDFVHEFCELGFNKCANIRASEYIYDMPMYLKAADAVICRSGAMTLSEIALSGCPSVLIPSPNVSGGHQYKNARAFSDASAAYTVDEREGKINEKTVEYVCKLITDPYHAKEMSEKVKGFAHFDPAQKIVQEIINSVKRR